MLQYKNNRFHCAGISFCIPDDFFFDCMCEELADNTIRLWAPDHSFDLCLRLEECCMGSKAEITSVIEGMAPTVVTPIEEITVNDLSGFHASYRSLRHQYYEIWLDIKDGIALNMVIETTGDILNIDATSVITAIDPCSTPK